MTIQCNDQKVQIHSHTLSDALLELGFAQETVATAINGEFVPRSSRSTTRLQPGDRLDVLAPMQGG